MAGTSDFWEDPFEDNDDFAGPPLTPAMIRAAEEDLGYKLPKAYIRLLEIKNGGCLKRNRFPTPASLSGAADPVEIFRLYGIGGQWGIDSEGFGSRYMIQEWGYPDVGIVIADTPSAGHDTIMLDYRQCGPRGEPRVIHVEMETVHAPVVSVLAESFETFLQGLVESESGRYGESDPALSQLMKERIGGNKADLENDAAWLDYRAALGGATTILRSVLPDETNHLSREITHLSEMLLLSLNAKATGRLSGKHRSQLQEVITFLDEFIRSTFMSMQPAAVVNARKQAAASRLIEARTTVEQIVQELGLSGN
jgi:SMI1-KNR4 cell-wall